MVNSPATTEGLLTPAQVVGLALHSFVNGSPKALRDLLDPQLVYQHEPGGQANTRKYYGPNKFLEDFRRLASANGLSRARFRVGIDSNSVIAYVPTKKNLAYWPEYIHFTFGNNGKIVNIVHYSDGISSWATTSPPMNQFAPSPTSSRSGR